MNTATEERLPSDSEKIERLTRFMEDQNKIIVKQQEQIRDQYQTILILQGRIHELKEQLAGLKK